nr:hypothetical protein [Tanacetum cinerariifolium]
GPSSALEPLVHGASDSCAAVSRDRQRRAATSADAVGQQSRVLDRHSAAGHVGPAVVSVQG